ncbi:MAG: hypothetical protein PSX36_15650 [bacterium]|nr:hypothetical protein [bacterium]
MEYVKLFQVLNQNKVKYLICGGLAVNIYGIPRMTADVDLLLDFDEPNLERFENSVKMLLFNQLLPVSIKTFISKEERQKAVTEKNLIAYSYYNSQLGYMNLDVLLDTPVEFETLWKNRSSRKITDTDIYLVGIEDLIQLKTYANRVQDQQDVILLSKLLK